MLNYQVLSIVLISTVCLSASAQQYCSILENSQIEHVELSYDIALAETNQISEAIEPKSLGILKHVRFQPVKDGVSVRSWCAGQGDGATAAKLLRNAPDTYRIGVRGSELPEKNSSPEKMLSLLGRILAGEWWPPLPAALGNDRMTMTFMLLAYPVEGQTAPTPYEASYVVEHLGTMRVNGVSCSRYHYSVSAPYERCSDRQGRTVDDPAEAVKRTQQKLVVDGELAIDDANGIVHSRTEALEFLMTEERRAKAADPWRITYGGGEQKKLTKLKLKSLETVYIDD